ncbi:HdeD family acid-resistance protein [Chitinophaga solisilvae]|uniref:HdeD family acid-resistance protein n=1 Tax=Chitinophaga solisilvae TaxID=1233460 RepID=A0A433WJK6_9BACT|nr:HdeD family acid-resistance protein [Chitinophaga solisilvae]NSL87117.1 HdeD family acid-resistance protein [Chitinophaga solisilvae]
MGQILSAIRNNVKYWWLYLLNGIIFLIAGFIVFRNPFSSYVLLSIFFSVTLFITGIMEIAFAAGNRKQMYGWGWSLASGIIDVIIGFILMIYPAISMAVIPLFLGFWFMFKGISLIVFAIQLNTDKIPNWGWVLLGGILLIILSVVILDNPALGAATILGLMAASFWITGILSIMYAFRLKHVKKIFKSVEEKF